MNGPTIEEVEAAVRSVLYPLLSPRHEAASVIFEGRLLSLRLAEALAERSGVIRLAPGTVVTPLARDFLKRRGVEVRFVSRGEAARVGDAGEWGFVFQSNSGVVQSLKREVLNQAEIWFDLGADTLDAARWVAGSERRGAAVLTDEAAAASWRANRVEGVRAAMAVNAEGVANAARSLGVNLLVVEPSGKSIWELKHLLNTFRRAGAPRPPAWIALETNGHADRGGHRPGHALAGASELAERSLGDRLADDPLRLAGVLGRPW